MFKSILYAFKLSQIASIIAEKGVHKFWLLVMKITDHESMLFLH